MSGVCVGMYRYVCVCVCVLWYVRAMGVLWHVGVGLGVRRCVG